MDSRSVCRMALLAATAILTTSGLRCPAQRSLTDGGGSSNFPDLVASVEASSAHSTYPIEELFIFSYPDGTYYSWCTDDTDSPNITIHMTEPILLYGFLSGGYSSGPGMSYVSNFTLSYSSSEGEPSRKYEYFLIVPSMGSPALLQSPVLATSLHLQVLDATMVSHNRVCWTLVLLGCLESEALSDVIPTSPVTAPLPSPTSASTSSPTLHYEFSSPAVPAASISSSPPTVPNQQCPTLAESREDYKSVAIAIPVVLVVLALVGVLAVLGVIVWRRSQGKKSVYAYAYTNTAEERSRSGTVREINNALYEDLPNKSIHKQAGEEQVYEDMKPADPVYEDMKRSDQMYDFVKPPESPTNDITSYRSSLMANPAYNSSPALPPKGEAVAAPDKQSTELGEYSYVALDVSVQV